MSDQDVCGPYPDASSFGDSYIDSNGAKINKPLTPDQNSAYLAAVSAYQQCLAKVQGTPPCPLGQYFYGSLVDGIWQGQCVSIYTGQPTTPVEISPQSAVGSMPPLTTSPAPVPPLPTTTPATRQVGMAFTIFATVTTKLPALARPSGGVSAKSQTIEIACRVNR